MTAKKWDPDEWLGRLPLLGSIIRVGRSRYTWRVQRIELRRTGWMLTVYGPIGANIAYGGRPLWLGKKPIRIRSEMGGWLTLDAHDPEQIKEID